jgi:hypothetical protein
MRAFRFDDVSVDCDADRVRKGVEDTFDGNVLNRGVKKGPHVSGI